MVCVCSVTGCRSKRTRDSKRYYSFPAIITTQGKQTEALSRKRRSAWITSLGRGDFKIGTNSKICSDHFKSGKPSKLYETGSEDWVPTVNMGHGGKVNLMRRCIGKTKARRGKISKFWVTPEDSKFDYTNQTLSGSLMVPRVIFDESTDALTLSKYKNLLSFTVHVGQDGYCDIVPNTDENENSHLELVLMPKAYLYDSNNYRETTKNVGNFALKVEPEDPEYEESACAGSNIVSQEEIMPNAIEDFVSFQSGLDETVPNQGGDNLGYVTHQEFPSLDENKISPLNSESTETGTTVILVERSMKSNVHVDNTSVSGSVDSINQPNYTEANMFIKQEVEEQEQEEEKQEPIQQLQSYSNKYFVMKDPNSGKTKPSILQRQISSLSVDQLFKYLKTTIKVNKTNEFEPWTSQMNTDFILFNQMAPMELPVVARQVVLNKDLTFSIRVHAQNLPENHVIYSANPKTLKCIVDIKSLLKQISTYNTCSGNHDRRSNHFFLLHSDSDPLHPAIREGNFGGKCMNGSTYEWTIRSKSCSLLIASFLDKCPECNMYYKTAKSAPVPNM